MPDFICWEPYQGGTAEDGKPIKSSDAQAAAEDFAERDWEGEEHDREIHVQDDAGAVTRWCVRAVPNVDFQARLLPGGDE